MAANAGGRAGAAGVNAANFKLKTDHFDFKTRVNQSQNTAERTQKIIAIGYTAILLFLSLRCCWETNIHQRWTDTQVVVTTFDLCSQFTSFSIILSNGKVTLPTKHLRSIERRKPSQLFRRTISYLAITLLLRATFIKIQELILIKMMHGLLESTDYKVLSNCEHITRQRIFICLKQQIMRNFYGIRVQSPKDYLWDI